MRKHKKDIPNSCPTCGSRNTTIDYQTEPSLDDIMTKLLTCNVCGAQWKEYFNLIYSGFSKDGVIFDENGVCTWEGWPNE